MSTTPPLPTRTITRLPSPGPPEKLTWETVGLALPAGHAVSDPPDPGVTADRFSSTAATFAAGTPPRPSTGNATQAPAATAPCAVPMPRRVSSKRAGAGTPTEPGTDASGVGAGIGAGAACAARPPVITTAATTALLKPT